MEIFKSAAGQGTGGWKTQRFPRGRRQFRAWVTHELRGLSTPLWCGQVSYPCGEKAGPMHSPRRPFEELNRADPV